MSLNDRLARLEQQITCRLPRPLCECAGTVYVIVDFDRITPLCQRCKGGFPVGTKIAPPHGTEPEEPETEIKQ
jgi:hypothetical protein